jgi:hypothetical protein
MKKTQKKKLKPDDPKQSARFIGLAKRNKADNDEELFEKACSKNYKEEKKF